MVSLLNFEHAFRRDAPTVRRSPILHLTSLMMQFGGPRSVQRGGRSLATPIASTCNSKTSMIFYYRCVAWSGSGHGCQSDHLQLPSTS